MGRRYNSILETIGNTPVVRINRIDSHGCELYVKVESFNPMGSVKDRLALGVIEAGEQDGSLKPGQTVVEATSGNTGIGLAMVCAQKGYPLVVTMAENFSVERRKLMRFLGAKVVLTPAHEKGSGMVNKAVELAEAHGWWQSRQFENPANAAIHERTTAREILRDFEDVTLDYWVTGFGTAGTLSGVSRVLRAESPKTRIIVCEPDNAPILASGTPQPSQGSHPLFRPHLMQGWGPDFIPELARPVLEQGRIDGFRAIEGQEALRCSAELAAKEGILVGISAGATFAGALAVAREAPAGSRILCMLPDTGERYLSTPLFEGVSAEMTDEELALSRSTPNYRFDQSGAAPAGVAPAGPLDRLAQQAVAEALAANPVVMFALEWCEFCWTVRKVFKAYGIPFVSLDLDSVAYQEDDLGGRIRAVLLDRTGQPTIPQIYIGGEHIGGATELFDACKDGSMAKLLDQANVSWNTAVDRDPYAFLPGWLHAR